MHATTRTLSRAQTLTTRQARGAVVVLTAALLGLAASPATARDAAPHDQAPALPVALAAIVIVPLAASEPVSVPVQAAWSVKTPTITVTANPKPVPPPTPALTRDRPASRGEAQPRVPIEEASAPAAAAGSIIDIAAQYVGVPYVHGGTTPAGFDCSGFTQYVYAQVGVSLPRTSADQGKVGTVIPRDQAQPGDLIWSPGHVALYAGGDQQIDAPRPGKTIQFRGIWQSNPVFIRVTG